MQPKRIKCKKDPKDAYFRRKYGIGLPEYNVLAEKQQWKCAICQESRPLVVEHDHKTGLVRGLACSPCNLALGHFRENPESMLRAIEYLQRSWSEYHEATEKADAALDAELY